MILSEMKRFFVGVFSKKISIPFTCIFTEIFVLEVFSVYF